MVKRTGVPEISRGMKFDRKTQTLSITKDAYRRIVILAPLGIEADPQTGNDSNRLVHPHDLLGFDIHLLSDFIFAFLDQSSLAYDVTCNRNFSSLGELKHVQAAKIFRKTHLHHERSSSKDCAQTYKLCGAPSSMKQKYCEQDE